MSKTTKRKLVWPKEMAWLVIWRTTVMAKDPRSAAKKAKLRQLKLHGASVFQVYGEEGRRIQVDLDEV